MSDRVVRDELLESERFLACPTDTHRLVFIALILRCDDYGNLEGGPRRLYRWMSGFTQITSEDNAIKLMSDLQDVDLARRYEVEGKEYWHIPRFRNSRRYWSRKYPASPYEEQIKQPTAENPDAGLAQTCASTSGGVGVGVGGTSGSSKTSTSIYAGGRDKPTPRKRKKQLRGADFAPPPWIPAEQWNAWIEMRTRQRKPPTVFALELAVAKLENLKEQGYAPGAVLAQSAFRGWAGLFPVKEDA